MACTGSENRGSFLRRVKGSSFIIPDLEAMIAHWPAAVNPHKTQCRDEVHGRLEKLFGPGKRLQKMKLANAALFGSSWWPYASAEDLCVLTHLSTWLFAWDDELDSAEYSDLVNHPEQAMAFCTETIEYVQACLAGERERGNISSNPIITDVGRVCDTVRRRYPAEKTQAFLLELIYFVQSCQVEIQDQTQKTFPTANEYLERRMGSGAVRVCLALSEFAYKMLLPARIMADQDMSMIWDATNIIICLMNDILSFKKEFAQGQVDSILPVLCSEHRSLEAATSVAASLILQAIRSLDDAAERLLRRYDGNVMLQGDLCRFIDSCKYACTGNLSWSLVSGRFNICQTTTKGGVVVLLDG